MNIIKIFLVAILLISATSTLHAQSSPQQDSKPDCNELSDRLRTDILKARADLKSCEKEAEGSYEISYNDPKYFGHNVCGATVPVSAKACVPVGREVCRIESYSERKVKSCWQKNKVLNNIERKKSEEARIAAEEKEWEDLKDLAENLNERQDKKGFSAEEAAEKQARETKNKIVEERQAKRGDSLSRIEKNARSYFDKKVVDSRAAGLWERKIVQNRRRNRQKEQSYRNAGLNAAWARPTFHQCITRCKQERHRWELLSNSQKWDNACRKGCENTNDSRIRNDVASRTSKKKKTRARNQNYSDPKRCLSRGTPSQGRLVVVNSCRRDVMFIGSTQSGFCARDKRNRGVWCGNFWIKANSRLRIKKIRQRDGKMDFVACYRRAWTASRCHLRR